MVSKLLQAATGFGKQLKDVAVLAVYFSGLFAGLFTLTLPDLQPIESAQYKAAKLGKQLLFSVDVARDSTYGAEMVIYAGNEYVGTLPIPQVGHRVTSATFNLPPLASQSNNFDITVYWKVDHWTAVIWPQELFYRVSVSNPGGG